MEIGKPVGSVTVGTNARGQRSGICQHSGHRSDNLCWLCQPFKLYQLSRWLYQPVGFISLLAVSAFLAVSAISLVKGAKFLNPQKVFFCFLKRWGLKTLLNGRGGTAVKPARPSPEFAPSWWRIGRDPALPHSVWCGWHGQSISLFGCISLLGCISYQPSEGSKVF